MGRTISIRFCVGKNEHGTQCMHNATERFRYASGYSDFCKPCALKVYEGHVQRLKEEIRDGKA